MPLPTHINKHMTSKEWVLLVILSILWGGSFFFNGIAVKELPTLTVVVCRVGLAAITLYGLMRIMGLKMPSAAPGSSSNSGSSSGRIWLAFFGMGLLNNALPFCLTVWGQHHLASGVASILNATTPLFTVIIAHGLTQDEKMTGGRLFGVFAGLIGVTIMIGEDTLRTLGIHMAAQIAILAAALSYAFAGVFGRRFRDMGVTPMATATGQVTASSILLLPMALIIDQPWTLPMPSLTTISALVGLATLSTALAYVIYFRLLATAGATNLLLVTFLIPISAIMLGVFVLGEDLDSKHVIGMALIGVGLIAIDGRMWKRVKRNP